MRLYQEATRVQAEQQKFLPQQRSSTLSTSPRVKLQPDLEGAQDGDLIYPKPSLSRSAPMSDSLETPQKENRTPSHDLPFRTVNWDQPPAPGLSLRKRSDPYDNVGMKHNAIDGSTQSYPSNPPRLDRAVTISHPMSHIPTPLLVKIKKEEEITSTWPDLPPSARRVSRPKERTAEARRLRKQEKDEWKRELELGKDKFAAEQESLFSAAKEKFSPDPLRTPSGGPGYY